MADTNSQSADARILSPHTSPHCIQRPHADIQHGCLTLTDHAPAEGALNPHINAPGHQGVEIQVTGSSVAPFTPRHHQSAQSVWADMMTAQTACHAIIPFYGISPNQPTALETSRDVCSTRTGRFYAGTSSAHGAVQAGATTTSAQAVVTPTMVPKTAPIINSLQVRQQSRVITPYKAEGWRNLLTTYGLLSKYPDIPNQLIHGLMVCAPVVS